MVKEYGRKNAGNCIQIRMDLTVDLPIEAANEVERLGILNFDECVYDENTGRLKASVSTTLYREGA